MKKTNYESLLDAFRELSSVTDEEVLTPQIKQMVKEGKEFSLRASGAAELEAAKQELEKSEEEDEIEVIDVNADTLEHVKDRKEYVGQVILQCNKCHANHFIDMSKLIVDDIDPEKYNVEDECPNCHVEGEGFELVGQVGKIAKEEPETPVEQPTIEEPASEEGQPEEATIENDEKADDEATIENDQEEPEPEAEAEVETPEEPEQEDADEFKDEEKDGMITTASEDEDEFELPALGDEFDDEDVRKDDTTDEDDDEDEKDEEDEVKEELEQPVQEEAKPVRRKLRLPTREALMRARSARITLTEELIQKVSLPESINKVIVTRDSRKIYEGLMEELPAEIAAASIDGFDVANGYLMVNVDPVTADVDMPVAKVLNPFIDDATTKIIV